MPSERHHELPARLDFEYYRKQAKNLLKAYRTGDADARTRVAEVVGEFPRRFALTDAQFVLASEHGFRSWGDFRHSLEADVEPARPVGRIGVGDDTAYEPRAHEVVAAIAAADEQRPDAIGASARELLSDDTYARRAGGACCRARTTPVPNRCLADRRHAARLTLLTAAAVSIK